MILIPHVQQRGQVWPMTVEVLFWDVETRKYLRGAVKLVQRETQLAR